MRVLICGGREYDDRDAVWQTLDDLRAKYGNLTVIQGGATGADMLAREWCYKQPSVRMINEPAQWGDISHPDAVVRYKANGQPYDAKAGPRRNAKMLREYNPHLVIAFPGGAGTKDMMSKAKRAGVKVIRAGQWKP